MPTAPPLTRPPHSTAGPAGRGVPTLPTAGPMAGPRLSFGRRRQLPWVAAGVVLIVGCALAFATVSSRSSTLRPVLVLTTSLPAGHVLEPSDLRSVALTGPALATISASSEATAVGRPLAIGLLAGSLLTPADMGQAAGVSAGQAVVALAVKPGQYPPMLSPGDHVQIINTTATPTTGSSAASAMPVVTATVIAVDGAPEGSAAAAVISLQITQTNAAAVAELGAQGDASLVLLPPGSGS